MSAIIRDTLQNIAGAEQIGKFDSSELVCQIYDNLYGLPIRSIQEILPLPAILPLPQLPDSIMGVCVFRDKVIPVLNLASQLDLTGEPPATEAWQMVVISHQERLCALAVRDIIEIINYTRDEIEPLPSTTEGEEYFFRGIKRTELGMVTLLDMNAVVEHCHLPRREQAAAQVETEAGQQDNQIISLIRLGEMRIAVKIDEIERIFRTPKVFPVEAAPAHIKGKALKPDADPVNPQPNDYFPVINMYQLLEQPEAKEDQRNLILPKQSDIPVGYYTGVVEEIREVSKADMAMIPPLTVTPQNDYVQGVLKFADELILLIDLDQVLRACDVVSA